MQLPKLTPLQSRFAASLFASLLLVIIYFAFTNPHFAYAAELEYAGDGQPRGGVDHNWNRLKEYAHSEEDGDIGLEKIDEKDGGPQFSLEGEDPEPEEQFNLQKRAVTLQQIPDNNVPGNLNINPNDYQVWFFSNTSLWAAYAPATPGLPPSDIDAISDDSQTRRKELRKRLEEESEDGHFEKRQTNGSRTVYISINTCLQPTWNGTGPQTGGPPQLTLYVSTTSSNQQPGPSGSENDQQVLPLSAGYANFSLSADGAMYMAVTAPSLPEGFTGGWNYALAASIDDYYHQLTTDTPFLYLVDSDSSAALLVTDNVTQAPAGSTTFDRWMNISAPFIVFAQNLNDSAITGLESSFCGLQNAPAQIMADVKDPTGITNSVQMGMTTRGLGNKPKEQFYIRSLNSSSQYHGILAMEGNSTNWGPGVVGGGGKVWQSMGFSTKSDGNCALMFNLDFCSEVAYAVPSNPHTLAFEALAALYDSNAANLYKNFTYSLEQVACNTTASAQYSLAKTCTDCAAAYKQWLCAVTIPRCEDYSSQLPYLQARNMGQDFINGSMIPNFILDEPYNPMNSAPGGSVAQQQTFISSTATNSSRNPNIIDQFILPGPYKELLPCDDLCYSLVQSCPASLGFGCPLPGRGLEVSYGFRSSDGSLTCSFLGAIYYLNAGTRLSGSGLAIGVGIATSALTLWYAL